MRLPTWAELQDDEEQLRVWEAPLDKPLFVAGPPGSGKSSLAVWRAAALADFLGRDEPVSLLAFNRMLRRTLKAVIVQQGTEIQGTEIYVATMHKFVGHHYWNLAKEDPPHHPDDRYAYLWEAMLDRSIGIGPSRKVLVVDEGQDLPSGFFQYASSCVAKSLSVFADEEQTIGTRRSTSTLEEIKRAGNLCDPILLSENHRNTPEIARLVECFHRGRLPAATTMRNGLGKLPILVKSSSDQTTADRIATDFRNRAGSVGVIVDRAETGRSIHRRLRNMLPNMRIDKYEAHCKNEDSIDILAPGITVLNKESVKGQEFDTVFILELERFIPCTDDAKLRAMYMMCARARDHLTLVYGPASLSKQAIAALPNEDILERTSWNNDD